MREFVKRFEVAAPIERVWAETIDIEAWPEWTPTVTRARRLDGGPIGPGSRVLIQQPKLPPALWIVESIDPPREMKLRTGIPMMRVIAHHRIDPAPSGCAVTLTIRIVGFFSALLARATRDINVRYLELEAEGLKRRCERPR